MPKLQPLCAAALQDTLPPRAFRAAQALVLSGSIALLGVVATLVIFYVMASPTFGWTGAAPLPERSLGAVPRNRRVHVAHTLVCPGKRSALSTAARESLDVLVRARTRCV